MDTQKYFVAVLAGVITFIVLLCASSISVLNQEASLRSAIEAKERSREASYDTMKKIISQKAQLPEAAKNDLVELLPEIIGGRNGGSIFKTINEQYPELTLPLYKDLASSIEIERKVFLREQKELFDVKREHDALLRSVYGGMICSIFGRNPIEVNTISSTITKDVMASGVDDDTVLFNTNGEQN